MYAKQNIAGQILLLTEAILQNCLRLENYTRGSNNSRCKTKVDILPGILICQRKWHHINHRKENRKKELIKYLLRTSSSIPKYHHNQIIFRIAETCAFFKTPRRNSGHSSHIFSSHFSISMEISQNMEHSPIPDKLIFPFNCHQTFTFNEGKTISLHSARLCHYAATIFQEFITFHICLYQKHCPTDGKKQNVVIEGAANFNIINVYKHLKMQ